MWLANRLRADLARRPQTVRPRASAKQTITPYSGSRPDQQMERSLLEWLGTGRSRQPKQARKSHDRHSCL